MNTIKIRNILFLSSLAIIGLLVAIPNKIFAAGLLGAFVIAALILYYAYEASTFMSTARKARRMSGLLPLFWQLWLLELSFLPCLSRKGVSLPPLPSVKVL